MKLFQYLVDEQIRIGGVAKDGQHLDLSACPEFESKCLDELVHEWTLHPESLNACIESAATMELDPSKLFCPIRNPSKLLCIGLNYRDHAIESGMDIPSEPVVFNKLNGTLCGPGDEILLPANSTQVDYEAELVVVIGKPAWRVSEAEAMDHVFGYTCGHDVSSRDWQLGRPGGQWLLGKSFPTFAPIGPHIVTADEVSDVGNLRIQMRVNGEMRQDSTTAQLIFSIPELVAHLSACCRLEPGDLIFTGTPPGVGMALEPPRYLQDGDLCEVEIEDIGVLSNRCKAE